MSHSRPNGVDDASADDGVAAVAAAVVAVADDGDVDVDDRCR